MLTEEIWKPVKGYEGKYEVSNLGRIKSLYGWNGHKLVKREYITYGYLQKMKSNYNRKRACLVDFHGKRKEVFVHRVVAEAFVDHPKGCDVVNHKDFNPLNNAADNLEWTTNLENHKYSTKAGRRGFYSMEERYHMAEDYTSDMKWDQLLEKYGGSKLAIRRAVKQCGVRVNRSRGRMYSIDLNVLLKELKEGKTNKELSEKYGCPRNLIARRRYQFRKAGELL
jgi:hypothetical protein